MEALLNHIVPFICLMAGAAICIAAEFLFKKGIIRLPEKYSKIVPNICVLLTVLIGSGLFVFLTVIGAGVEIMLPVILLILLGTLI